MFENTNLTGLVAFENTKRIWFDIRAAAVSRSLGFQKHLASGIVASASPVTMTAGGVFRPRRPSRPAGLAGDIDTGKAILRDYIKATIGFEKLGEATGTQPKSLIRMFGPRGNPQARNLFSVLGYLQKRAGVELHVMMGPG